jgi:hypothetical protein
MLHRILRRCAYLNKIKSTPYKKIQRLLDPVILPSQHARVLRRLFVTSARPDKLFVPSPTTKPFGMPEIGCKLWKRIFPNETRARRNCRAFTARETGESDQAISYASQLVGQAIRFSRLDYKAQSKGCRQRGVEQGGSGAQVTNKQVFAKVWYRDLF